MSSICGLIRLAGPPARGEELRAMLTVDGGDPGPGWQTSRVGSEAAELGGRHGAGGRLGIVADARLDNRDELLAALGEDRRASTLGDDGLILLAYRRWGERCAERLLGDFAFAIWDRARRRLFCARDPLGVRTLHYASLPGRIAFSSDAAPLLRNPGLSGRLDEGVIGTFLCGGSAPPEQTMFREVNSLPPGHRLTASARGVRVERYWDVAAREPLRLGSDRDYAACFLELFVRAVEARLLDAGCGPVAVAMSGGLDSTSVAAMVQHLRRARDLGPGPVAYSMVFDRLPECDERRYIRAMQEELDIPVETLVADRLPPWSAAAGCGTNLETPLLTGWEGCFGELLSGLATRGIRVLLTGHGGDDLLSGSPLAYFDRLCSGELMALCELLRDGRACGRSALGLLGRWVAAPLLPDRVRQMLGRVRGSTAIPPWVDRGFARRTGLRERLRGEPADRRFDDRGRQSLYEQLVVSSSHRMATRWYELQAAGSGVEVRHPFLDRRLVELVLSLPPEQLFRGPVLKPLLRRAMSGLLPERVRQRRGRTRLGPFLDLGLRRPQEDWIEGLLRDPLVVELGWLDGSELRRAFQACRVGLGGPVHRLLLCVIGLELWLRRHVVHPSRGLEVAETAGPDRRQGAAA